MAASEDPLVGGSFMAVLEAAYRQPERAYHTFGHARVVAQLVRELGGDRACELAAWAHDVVHDPRADDNEMRSAEWLRAALPEDPDTAEAARLVLVTAGHEPSPDDLQGQVLCDADLAVLGRPPTGYEWYRRAVRREYAHLPDEVWRAGRLAVLQNLLDREHLFHTDLAVRRWASRARQNLRAEIRSLA